MLANSVLGIDIVPIQEQHLILKTTTIVAAREQYIANITNWVTESANPPSSMYWMRGPAGVGKSAITRTCTEKLKETGHLGAAFFFTATKHTNPSCLFTTIAYQLATTIPDYHTIIDERISKDKTLIEK